MSFIDKSEEKDDFWDLEKIVPKKKNATLSPFASRPTVSDYSVKLEEEDNVDKRAEERKLNFVAPTTVEESDDTVYYPVDTLIKSITIKKYKEKYDFYDSFRKAALLYYDCPGEKCEFAQFYSYMPQYSQLTKAQKSYYFYWRSEMRRGRFIKTDYSYVYLYVYEVINLPDVISPEDGLKLLCRVWREYRSALPRMDMYFSIWVRDYCLVHGLSCPISEIQDFIFDVIRISDFKEYYFTDVGATSKDSVWSLIAYLSDYDWHRGLTSVVGSPEAEDYGRKSEIYKTLLEGAIRVILPSIWDACMKEKKDGRVVKISRAAFPNTLCTHSVKCRLEIEYYPLADAVELRAGITSAVRYAENKIRALFGAKSRLSVKYIPLEYKELIDCYFDELVRKSASRVKKQNVPEYEKQYDAPREKLSFAGADEIERLSWDTTMRLCEGEELEEQTVCEVVEDKSEEKADYATKSEKSVNDYGLSPSDIAFIRALVDSFAAVSVNIDDEPIVERINEAFSDGFGDVIIEDTGDGFVIIEDYREEIIEWLKNI